MRTIFIVCLVSVCMLRAGFPQGTDKSNAKVPEHALYLVSLGKKGDGLAMAAANHACEAWGVRRPFKPAEVQNALLPLAQAGNSKAMWEMGISMVRFAEPGPGSDQEKGKVWIRRAAEAGHPPAMLNMTSQTHDRELTNQWITRAYEALLPKAESGDVEAMMELQHVPYLMGDARHLGKPLVTNEEKEQWLRKAKDQGSVDAIILLVEYLSLNRGRTRDEKLAERKESMDLSMKLVAMGNWPAMADIGAIYATGTWPRSSWKPTDLGPDGEKLRANPTKAWEWWDKAIAIAGNDTVLKYLLEHQGLGNAEENECQQIPSRPK